MYTPTLRLLLWLMRMGLGLFFLYTAVMKLGDMTTTASFLTRSDLLPELFSMPLAALGLAMEFLVGLAFLFKFSFRAAATWSVVMTSCYLALFLQAWARGLELSCNCLGSDTPIMNYPLDSAYRLLLLFACITMLWHACNEERRGPASKKLDFSKA